MVLHSLRKKVPILCYMVWDYWRNLAAYLSLSHHCQYMWYCAYRDRRRIFFWNQFTRLGLISFSLCFKHRFMWFHRDYSNGKLSVVNKNNLVSFHFSEELACMFSLKGGRLPHLLFKYWAAVSYRLFSLNLLRRVFEISFVWMSDIPFVKKGFTFSYYEEVVE